MKMRTIILIACIAVVVVALAAVWFLQKDQSDNPVVSAGVENAENAEEVLPDTEYTVMFLSSDGVILDTQIVRYGNAAIPPDNPIMLYGEVFRGWDTDFSYVTENLMVGAVVETVIGTKNAIALGDGYCVKEGEVTIPLQLCGDVCVSGLDITISYDPKELSFVEFPYEDGAVVTNCLENKGEIKLNYVSAENTTADVDLCDITFEAVGDAGQTDVTITVEQIVAYGDETENGDEDVPEHYSPEYTLMDATVTISES